MSPFKIGKLQAVMHRNRYVLMTDTGYVLAAINPNFDNSGYMATDKAVTEALAECWNRRAEQPDLIDLDPISGLEDLFLGDSDV